jgi:hypothetical protein
LNHPAVSRVQAGIKEINGAYYLFSLRPSNRVRLNDKEVEENEALSPGDILEVGPFLLEIDSSDDALVIKVSLQIGLTAVHADASSPEISTAKLLSQAAAEKSPAKPRPAPLPGDKALDIFWDKRIREAGKMVRPSPLFPKSQRRTGKAQFNWTPTTDLLSRWPVSFFIWGAIAVSLLSVAAAYWYTSAYTPGPISNAHAKAKLEIFPPIASRANANSCTNCHSLSGDMQARCAACHAAESFVATVIPEHAAAGVGCRDCHAEHRGKDFRPAHAALGTCTECHTDTNKKLYNGHGVSTPHGGTFGYPVVAGKWKWKGLDQEEWALRKIEVAKLPVDSDEKWRSKQFHALHVTRVRAVPGMKGDAEGHLSCSSCHKTFNPIDRETPRTTCGACHDGMIEPGTNQVLISKDKPNCISCHVQHTKDKRHWNPSLLAVTN